MSKLDLKTDPRIETVFEKYPNDIKEKMQYLRKLVIETAEEAVDIETLEETLKWGQPSFITPKGSTLRMDWRRNSPDEFAMYFQCTSRLVETFRLAFGNKFKFEGNRAIVFHVNEQIPEQELKACIKATLTYHLVKKEITLGI